MPLFRYKAALPSGEVVEGEMEVSDQDVVIRRLHAQGYLPIRADPVTAARAPRSARALRLGQRGVSRREVEELTGELATLLQAGLALDKALEVLQGLGEREPVCALLARLQAEVRGGASLSAAMESQGAVFSRFHVNMVRAGEAAGALDAALARLAEFMERSRELRESVTSALVYPLILVCVAVLSLAVILTFVVPRFSQMFADAGQTLPLPTQVVIAAGDFFQHWWWLLAVMLASVWLYMRRVWRDPAKRRPWDARLLRAPMVGGLVTRIETARFARTLGTLLRNGVPLLASVGIAREILANQVVAQGVERVAQSIREGQGLARPLLEVRVFPPLATQLLQLGEETGNLEEMLLRVATIYEREVQTTLRRLIAVLEPAMILGLGVLVGGIILSIVMAILKVNQLAG